MEHELDQIARILDDAHIEPMNIVDRVRMMARRLDMALDRAATAEHERDSIIAQLEAKGISVEVQRG